MRTQHPNPRPTAPNAAAPRHSRVRAALALRPGHLVATVLALAPLLLGTCTDQVAVNCPPLAHPEVLTVAAAAGNPCAARAGASAALLALRVVRTYQRTSALASGLPTRFPLRCGDAGYGYLHLVDALTKGRSDHGDPVNDATFDAEIAHTIDQGVPFDQGNNNWRLTVRFNDVQSACHSGDWGFRVVVATNQPPHPPLMWKPDGLVVGVITAFGLPTGPPAVSYL